MVPVLRMHLGYGCPQAVVQWHPPPGHTWAGEMGPRGTLWPPDRPGLAMPRAEPLNGAMCAPVRISSHFRGLWTHKQR